MHTFKTECAGSYRPVSLISVLRMLSKKIAPKSCTQAHKSNWEHTLHGLSDSTLCSNILFAFYDEMNGSADDSRTLDAI